MREEEVDYLVLRNRILDLLVARVIPSLDFVDLLVLIRIGGCRRLLSRRL